MENKQTVVDKLHNEVIKLLKEIRDNGLDIEQALIANEIRYFEAKQMEKEQIIKAFNEPLFSKFQTAEQYYNETYGRKKQNEDE